MRVTLQILSLLMNTLLLNIEQGEAGVAPKSARTMYRFKMDLLMENMRLTIKGKKGVLKLRLSERRAMYAY